MLSRSTPTGKAGSEGGGEGAPADVLLRDLPTPAFVVNREAFASNCQRVLELAKERQLHVRPHIKTHKTLEGISLQASGTGSHSSPAVSGFVASTLPEVKLLVNYYTSRSGGGGGGGRSILYGVPISETKLPALCALQERLFLWHKQQDPPGSTSATCSTSGTPIVILMDHVDQIEMVRRFLETQKEAQIQSQAKTHPDFQLQHFQVMLKLDTGYHRAGTTCDQSGVQLADAIVQQPFLKFVGVYSHW